MALIFRHLDEEMEMCQGQQSLQSKHNKQVRLKRRLTSNSGEFYKRNPQLAHTQYDARIEIDREAK